MVFPLFTLVCPFLVSLFKSCLDNHVGETFDLHVGVASDLSTRQNLAANSLIFWLLKFFCSSSAMFPDL